MKAVKITDGIYCLPVNLESYQLFEGMWPMPNGISLNSYIVQGEKTALIGESGKGKSTFLKRQVARPQFHWKKKKERKKRKRKRRKKLNTMYTAFEFHFFFPFRVSLADNSCSGFICHLDHTP